MNCTEEKISYFPQENRSTKQEWC